MPSPILRGRKWLPRVPLGAISVPHKMAWAGDGIQVVVKVLRNATWSRRSFTSSAQLGESFQRGGANVRGSLSSMLLTGALLRRAACKGKYTATGSMFEGLYVFVAWSRKGSDFEPWLIEKELIFGQNFLFNLPNHVLRRRGSN